MRTFRITEVQEDHVCAVVTDGGVTFGQMLRGLEPGTRTELLQQVRARLEAVATPTLPQRVRLDVLQSDIGQDMAL